MARSLTIISEFHYGFRREAQSTAVEGYRELQNLMSESLWSSDFMMSDLESRHFDAAYVESICSHLQAWKLRRKLKKMKYEEIDKDNLRDRYLHRLISRGAKFRLTENVFWHGFHEIYRVLGGREKEFEYKLADRRDRSMAHNIANTLRDGENAVLIVGTAHMPEKYLAEIAPDIILDLRLKFKYPRAQLNSGQPVGSCRLRKQVRKFRPPIAQKVFAVPLGKISREICEWSGAQ